MSSEALPVHRSISTVAPSSLLCDTRETARRTPLSACCLYGGSSQSLPGKVDARDPRAGVFIAHDPVTAGSQAEAVAGSSQLRPAAASGEQRRRQ
mmetsp:Transcript_3053/g.7120  ORF Transcript_3053/g.7120 Transcript_3053/m.7120 type:complete len:95 (+) Transcript_3053:2211-2495(+)